MAPREKKPNKSCSDDDDLQRKKETLFKQRFPCFKKKATKLSVHCGNSVAFICYGPDDDLHVWPQPQDHNPQTLPEIVAKFNALIDYKRKHHACDLYEFPNLKGVSGDELRNHLVNLDSHLVGVKKQKISILKRSILKKPKPKETEENDHLRVSDNSAIISNRKVGLCLPWLPRKCSNLESSATSKVSKDVVIPDSSRLDPFTLGFSGSEYFPADPMEITDNWGVCANSGVWDPSWLDFDCSSTLFTDDWTVSGYTPLLRATDSFTASIYKRRSKDSLGSVF
ncbi:predicted protein [Arabidopsis lyrata subsp. lyrata]|uniref:Predicted protein n=1 Tax=Arabidopsis lyrata subsp. lyrata TaxID=81972 RepID=D7KXS8_ARALL|nr:predicted protein [Arabidopsis lyrata subsp. lyrata]